jgi:hypothetical protein
MFDLTAAISVGAAMIYLTTCCIRILRGFYAALAILLSVLDSLQYSAKIPEELKAFQMEQMLDALPGPQACRDILQVNAEVPSLTLNLDDNKCPR